MTDQECHVVESVKENMEGFTQREVNQAKCAQELYTMCIKPTVCNLKHLISGNFVKNCPVMVEDITIAERIFGIDLKSIREYRSNHKQSQLVLSDLTSSMTYSILIE